MGDKLYEFTTRFGGEEFELDVYICPKHRANEILIALAHIVIGVIGLFVGYFEYLGWPAAHPGFKCWRVLPAAKTEAYLHRRKSRHLQRGRYRFSGSAHGEAPRRHDEYSRD